MTKKEFTKRFCKRAKLFNTFSDSLVDCFESTDEKGKKEIKITLKQIPPEKANDLINAFEHITFTALMDFLHKKDK